MTHRFYQTFAPTEMDPDLVFVFPLLRLGVLSQRKQNSVFWAYWRPQLKYFTLFLVARRKQ